MLFDPHNFLTFIKMIVTGGGRDSAGVPANDAGLLRDVNSSLKDFAPASIVSLTDNSAGTANDTVQALSDGTTYANDVAAIRNNFADLAGKINTMIAAMQLSAVETNLSGLKAPASTTAVGTFEFAVPRDYDEATDTLAFRMMAAMSGATNSPALTISAYRKRAGSAIATMSASIAMSSLGASSISGTLGSMAQFDLSGFGLLRDDVVTIKVTAAAHTTDDLYVLSAYPIYRSTIVSYNELDSSSRSLR